MQKKVSTLISDMFCCVRVVQLGVGNVFRLERSPHETEGSTLHGCSYVEPTHLLSPSLHFSLIYIQRVCTKCSIDLLP